MSSKLSLENYLATIPEEHRNNVRILDKFCGKRTKVLFKYGCGCEHERDLGSLSKNNCFDSCSNCRGKPEFSRRKKQLYCARCGQRTAVKDVEKTRKRM